MCDEYHEKAACGIDPSPGMDPLILEIKGNSLDDGPGIRTVIFFKGCPLSCVWCHNPESKRCGMELSFDASECIACDGCLDVCDRQALSRSNSGFVDRERCDLCFRCVDACPAQSLTRVGMRLEVREILEVVGKDIPFFRTSGGGVTLSGGEPTVFMHFVSELLQGLKMMGVSSLIETCGHFDLGRFDELVYPHVDLIYFDLKLFDGAEHREYCGVPNGHILESFSALHLRTRYGGVPVLPRIPLVPGITATEQNLGALASFLRENGSERVALLPYNPMWMDKNNKIGRENPFTGDDSKSTWMNASEIERCRSFFYGLTVV
jgi:pyruvate formate lyase activating enzyme